MSLLQEFEHFADPNDYASALEQSVVDATLESIPRYVLPKDFDGTCTECGEEVHSARIKLGISTCIDCAELAERRSRAYRRH